jgi:hypothetical protein
MANLNFYFFLVNNLGVKLLQPIFQQLSKSARLCSHILLATLISFSTLVFSPQTKAADLHGTPNMNGKIVKFELSNGVRINLPMSRAIDTYWLNSYVPDNTDDWQFKVIDDGYGQMYTRINTNKAMSVESLTVVNGTHIRAYEQSGHGRWNDFNPEAIGDGYYLVHLRYNTSQCLNIPGSQSNVWVTTWACNANDPDQRFRIVEVGNSAPVQTQPDFSGLIRTGGSSASGAISNARLRDVPFTGELRALDFYGNGREWVYGGIQYIDICNGKGGYNAIVKAQFTTSSGVSIGHVQFKMYSRWDRGFYLGNQWIGYTSSADWRNWIDVDSTPNSTSYSSLNQIVFVGAGINQSSPVKFSSWVHVNAPGMTNLPIYDIGGVIDLGNIPSGECRTFQR